MGGNSTEGQEYTERLKRLEGTGWKMLLDVQRPYRWNLARLRPGRTLDIGCGIGRVLKGLPEGSVGVDHNPHSIAWVAARGLTGFTPEEFRVSPQCEPKSFDTLLFSHILEHMTPDHAIALIAQYLPYLRSRGRVILICPQEKGYLSDPTHVHFFDKSGLNALLASAGLTPEKNYSFPFPSVAGKLFTYNESIAIGRSRL